MSRPRFGAGSDARNAIAPSMEYDPGVLRRAQSQSEPSRLEDPVLFPLPLAERGLPARSPKQRFPTFHILFVMYGWHEEGGGTILPRQLARAIARRGHQISVIYAAVRPGPAKSQCYIEESAEDGIRLFAVYNRPAAFLDLQHPEREVNCQAVRDMIYEVVVRLKPDLIHYHNLVSLSMGVAEAVARAGVPTLYTSHNYWALCPRLYLYKEDLSLCSGPASDGGNCAECAGIPGRKDAAFARRAEEGRRIFRTCISRHHAVSERMREIYIANGHDPGRIRVLQQQPETVEIIWEKVGSKMRQAHQNGPLRIGSIGNVYAHKGIDILVRALQRFSRNQVECHIHGGGAESYVNSVRQLDHGRLARFHGDYSLSELPGILEGIDLVVVPSVCEDSAPLVVAEALAARVPVVGSKIGGIPDFINEGINGFLFRARDPNSLAEVLNRFIQAPSLLAAMQRNIVRPRGFANFVSEVIEQYEELIFAADKPMERSTSGCAAGTAILDEASKTGDRPAMQAAGTRQKFSLFHSEGKEESIKKWISPYADAFKGCSNVLDVGCGPGIFLEALSERGISCQGIDYDPDMVNVCNQKGLQAKVADVRGLELYREAFGGIHLGHVIEHMDGEAALKLIEQCANALKPAGLLLIRTPNWGNATVRREGFWLDHTHVRPYPLPLLERIFADLEFQIVAKGFEEQGWNDAYILGRKKTVARRLAKDAIAKSEEGAGTNRNCAVIWEGSQFVHHSLALINREICLQLIDRGYNLSITPYEKHEFGPEADPRFPELARRFNHTISFNGSQGVHVRHQWPPKFTPPPSGHWVMIQPWEFGRIPQDWLEPMSTLVDEIWVPSRHVLKSYVSSGVPANRVIVIPNGVNTGLFHPGALPCPLPTRKKFKFLFIGGTIWRKGIDLLLEAYRTTFRREDDVTLLIKDMGGDSFYQGQGARQKIRQIQKDPLAPEIFYSTDKLEEAEMPRLFAAADCLVHPYRGEGFGLPVLEAMACGVPVITTEGGSTDDFCSQEQAFLIASSRREINDMEFELAGGAGWVLEPDLESLKNLMREAFEKATEAKQRALAVSEDIRRRYDWTIIGEMVVERLDRLVGQPVRRGAN